MKKPIGAVLALALLISPCIGAVVEGEQAPLDYPGPEYSKPSAKLIQLRKPAFSSTAGQLDSGAIVPTIRWSRREIKECAAMTPA